MLAKLDQRIIQQELLVPSLFAVTTPTLSEFLLVTEEDAASTDPTLTRVVVVVVVSGTGRDTAMAVPGAATVVARSTNAATVTLDARRATFWASANARFSRMWRSCACSSSTCARATDKGTSGSSWSLLLLLLSPFVQCAGCVDADGG